MFLCSSNLYAIKSQFYFITMNNKFQLFFANEAICPFSNLITSWPWHLNQLHAVSNHISYQKQFYTDRHINTLCYIYISIRAVHCGGSRENIQNLQSFATHYIQYRQIKVNKLFLIWIYFYVKLYIYCVCMCVCKDVKRRLFHMISCSC